VGQLRAIYIVKSCGTTASARRGCALSSISASLRVFPLRGGTRGRSVSAETIIQKNIRARDFTTTIITSRKAIAKRGFGESAIPLNPFLFFVFAEKKGKPSRSGWNRVRRQRRESDESQPGVRDHRLIMAAN